MDVPLLRGAKLLLEEVHRSPAYVSICAQLCAAEGHAFEHALPGFELSLSAREWKLYGVLIAKHIADAGYAMEVGAGERVVVRCYANL